MKERTLIADKYFLEHFYETCSKESKEQKKCCGVKIEENYSWIDVVLDGGRLCGKCENLAEGQGFYYGKGAYSLNFDKQEYVTLSKIRTQDEFVSVCQSVNPDVKGMVIDGAVSDASPLESFPQLEFVVFEGHRIPHFWNTAKTPKLRMLTMWVNKYLKSLKGLEHAENLECLQFYTLFSDVAIHKIESLEPISKLKRLKEIVIACTEPMDHNIDYLIDLPALEVLLLSSNIFPIECYAKFEAKRFMLGDEYGIYCEDSTDIYPYGKGKRVMHTKEQKARYLKDYMELMEKYK